MYDFAAFIQSVTTGLFTLLGLTVVDFILGVSVALVKKVFSWDKLAHYIETDILPILGWLAVQFILTLPAIPDQANTVISVGLAGVYGTVFLEILGSILGSLAAIGVFKQQLRKIGVNPDVDSTSATA